MFTQTSFVCILTIVYMKYVRFGAGAGKCVFASATGTVKTQLHGSIIKENKKCFFHWNIDACRHFFTQTIFQSWFLILTTTKHTLDFKICWLKMEQICKQKLPHQWNTPFVINLRSCERVLNKAYMVFPPVNEPKII